MGSDRLTGPATVNFYDSVNQAKSNSAPTDARDEAFLATMQQSPNRMPVWARRRLEEIKGELEILESDAVNAPRGLIDALKDEQKTILAATGGKS